MIGTIRLNNVLPEVFDGQQHTAPVKDSCIWLRDVTLAKPLPYLIFASSGTGKSSLCSFLYGSRTDYSGTITFDGTDIREFGLDRWSELRRLSLAYLPQELRLFPELTAMENIMIKNRLTDFYTEADILQLLDRLDIREKADIPAGRLSIGQQQRVATIRAICQPFDFIILDEPVSHLDAGNNTTVAELITERAGQQHAAIIATSVGNHLAIDSFNIMRL